jgi:hypothetical protein
VDKGKGTTDKPKVEPIVKSEVEALEFAEKAGIPDWPELCEDGGISFHDGCVILKPTEDGKLKLTIEPTKCGEATGKVLLDYLIKTAGKGVIIEIPPAQEEPAIKVIPGKVIEVK